MISWSKTRGSRAGAQADGGSAVGLTMIWRAWRCSETVADRAVEIDNEHLDPPTTERFSEPASPGHTCRSGLVAEGDDQPGTGAVARKGDQLQGIPSNLMKLCSLQPSLSSEDLNEDRLVVGNTVDIDACPFRE